MTRLPTSRILFGVFHRIVLAHLNLNQPEKALEYIERSKARNLVELMTQKNVKPQGVDQATIDKLDELRQRMVNEQIRLQSRSINQNISSNDKLTPYISDDSHLIHALPIEDNHILQDKYNVQYAPSCQLLQITQKRPLNQLTNLFAIQNPQNNLLFTDLEVEIIKTLFVQSEVLAKQNATETALKTHKNFPSANCIHFSCHGTFNPNNPLDSALILTKEQTDQEDGYLTLGEIFELNLKNCRLITLSACETGLIDLKSGRVLLLQDFNYYGI